MEIRLFELGDADGVIDVFASQFDDPADPAMRARARHRLDANLRLFPVEPGPIMVVAEEAGRIVGFEQLLPQRFVAAGETLVGALSCWTTVDPSRRGRGLFVAMVERAEARARELGVHFVYGWPNENSRHGFVKRLAWREIGRTVRRTRRVNRAAAAARGLARRGFARSARVLDRLAAVQIGAGPRRPLAITPDLPWWYTDLWQRVRPTCSFGLDRDAPFLRYKGYQQGYLLAWRPDAAVDARAVLAFLPGDGGVWTLSEAVFGPDAADAAAALLRDAAAALVACGLAHLTTWEADARWRDVLDRSGFASEAAAELPAFGKPLAGGPELPPIERWEMMPSASDMR